MRSRIAFAIRAVRAGRGRWAALVWLLILSAPLAVPAWSPLGQIRLWWFDLYQIVLPRERRSGPVTIVDIDARALEEFGQWPWPRTVLAELIDHLGTLGARAIGLDIIMPEHDQNSPEALIGRLGSEHRTVIEALAGMPTYDSLLAKAVAQHPVVLGAAGFDTYDPGTSAGLRTWPLVIKGSELPASLRHYPVALASLPRLQAAASGQGLLSADLERGVIRRVPLMSTVGPTPVPAFALELVRVAIGAPAIAVDTRRGGVDSVQVGDLRVPTQPSGEMWLHFTPPLPERYVSAVDVMLDRVDESWIRDKIVIVALTGIGLVDYKTTPQGDYVPGVDVHAQMIESFFDSRSLTRPSWLPLAEAGSFALLAGVLIWAVPIARRSLAVVLFLAMPALIVALGFTLFAWPGILFDAASVTLALLVVVASLFASALAQADHDRRASEESLRAARESAARVTGELEAARRIQLGILPHAESSFPNERRFELAAAVEPARAVGGDLYDFFMLDADRLFLHIADVSGKGIPASLFMSITKVLTKSVALRAGGNGAPLLTQANIEISRDNPESLFVTAFAAILDVTSGHLRYWTAGHDTPFVYDGLGAHQLDRSESGPPLCVLGDYDYPEQGCELSPGSTVVLFTDGVSEAENPAGAQYGKERLARCLTTLPPNASAEATLAAIRSDVDAFVAGAPASDDLTLVVLRWLGPTAAVSAR
ncbi:MAG: CHASE2 domain-containing protein [Betaproteobacteria bacterium]|nr:MAG: CHASE2 domain-containing protein [Betaproteobacteria bacterium]